MDDKSEVNEYSGPDELQTVHSAEPVAVPFLPIQNSLPILKGQVESTTVDAVPEFGVSGSSIGVHSLGDLAYKLV